MKKEMEILIIYQKNEKFSGKLGGGRGREGIDPLGIAKITLHLSLIQNMKLLVIFPPFHPDIPNS